jgi:hypothetical protein
MLAKILDFLFHAGDLFLPARLVAFLNTYLVGDDTTVFYISLWSVVHFLSGCVAGLLLGNESGVAFIVHWMWEMLQVVSGMTPATGRGFVDFVTDTCMFMGGYALTGLV